MPATEVDADATTSVEAWVNRIGPHLAGAAEHIVAAGRELIDAKAALEHGKFGPLLERLGLTPRTAQRFMAIAANPALANATHGSHLPMAWTTLFELSRLDADVLEAALGDGTITESMTRAEAMALLNGITNILTGDSGTSITLPSNLDEARIRLNELDREVSDLERLRAAIVAAAPPPEPSKFQGTIMAARNLKATTVAFAEVMLRDDFDDAALPEFADVLADEGYEHTIDALRRYRKLGLRHGSTLLAELLFSDEDL